MHFQLKQNKALYTFNTKINIIYHWGRLLPNKFGYLDNNQIVGHCEYKGNESLVYIVLICGFETILWWYGEKFLFLIKYKGII